jgi:hypothetical protein
MTFLRDIDIDMFFELDIDIDIKDRDRDRDISSRLLISSRLRKRFSLGTKILNDA